MALTNAEKQAAFKVRMVTAGFKQVQIWWKDEKGMTIKELIRHTQKEIAKVNKRSGEAAALAYCETIFKTILGNMGNGRTVGDKNE